MPPPRNGQPFLVQLGDLLLIQLSNWRWSWRGTVITGMITPLVSILALGLFARDSGQVALAYILTGNVVMALTFENLNKVASNFAYMRFTGAFNYFATLPLARAALILASLGAFLLLSLPALLVTLGAGAWLLGVPLAPSPLLLLVVPLAAIPLAALGALIGSSIQRPEDAGNLSLLVTLAMLALGPVLVPPDRLPAPLLTLGLLSPATYAASALRQTLLGPVTARLALDLLVLGGLAVALLWLVGRKMDWRQP